MAVPGATVRQLPDFGEAPTRRSAPNTCSLAAGTDIALCSWGSRATCASRRTGATLVPASWSVTYADGETEHVSAGEVFHWPAGHSVRVEEDAEVILFSPQAEHLAVMDHMKERLSAVS